MTEAWLARPGAPGGASDADLDEAERRLDIRLPQDYREVMRRSDGGEAEFGESWIRLWCVTDLVEHNEGYEAEALAPGFTFFGSDGGGEAYAWDWRQTRRSLYVVIPFISPDPQAAVPCGESFEAFLTTLFSGIPFGG